MIGFILILFSLEVFGASCRVTAVKALENPALLPLKGKIAVQKARLSVANLTKEFGITFATTCSGNICGRDPKIDQASRENVNQWIARAEKLSKSEQDELKALIRDWLIVEMRFLLKENVAPAERNLRISKINFIDARLRERKSALSGLFCLD